VYKQIEALQEVKVFLDQHAVQYVVIGGIANAVWGRPRATHDADFKVVIGERTIDEFVALLGTQFRFRVPDPVAFTQRTFVATIYTSNHIEVDLVIGFLPYEEQAIERAITVEHSGVTFPVCTAEDLVIHKAISEREKDWDDIEGVLARQGDKLDQSYIAHWLTQFAQALEWPELMQRYRELCKNMEELETNLGGEYGNHPTV